MRPIRGFLLVIFCIMSCNCVKGQQSLPRPLGFTWQQFDSTGVQLSKLGIVQVNDTVFSESKPLTATFKRVDSTGRVVGMGNYEFNTKRRTQFRFEYDSKGRLIREEMTTEIGGKPEQNIVLRALTIAPGEELTVWEYSDLIAVSSVEYETDNDLKLRYVDTKAKLTWSEGYINRTIGYLQSDTTHHSYSFTYFMHENDTLMVVKTWHDEANNDWTEREKHFENDIVTKSTYQNNKLQDTRTFDNGMLIEHHRYSSPNLGNGQLVCLVYDQLEDSTRAEVTIMYGDTIKVWKDDHFILIDVLPDTRSDHDAWLGDAKPVIAKPEFNLSDPELIMISKKRPDGGSTVEYYKIISNSEAVKYIVEMDKNGLVEYIGDGVNGTKRTYVYK